MPQTKISSCPPLWLAGTNHRLDDDLLVSAGVCVCRGFLLQAAFASVTVWLFPAPVEMTSELSKELKSEDLSEVCTTVCSFAHDHCTARVVIVLYDSLYRNPCLTDVCPRPCYRYCRLVPPMLPMILLCRTYIYLADVRPPRRSHTADASFAVASYCTVL